MTKQTSTIIVQGNELTTSHYDMTSMEKNILYSIMAQLKEEDAPTKYYLISKKDIENVTGRRTRNDDFESAVTRLLTRDFMAVKKDGRTLQITFISSAEYHEDGRVEIGLDGKIRPFLFALKDNFTSFGFEIAISLNSKYSKRLYEMLCQFRSTGVLRISVKKLKERFLLIDQNGTEQYSKWSSFEANVLKTSKDEINEKANFKVDYKLIKENRKIVSVEFEFGKSDVKELHESANVQTNLAKQNLDPRTDRSIERLKNYGLNESKISMILKIHSIDIICKILYKCDENKSNITSHVGFLCKEFGI